MRPVDRGRPISDLTHRLGYDRLIDDAETVLQHLVPIEHELQDESGRWYLVRVLPYRSSEDRIEGVVLTFVGITLRKCSEEALRRSEEKLRQLNQHLEQQVSERTATIKLLQDVTRAANEPRGVDEAIRESIELILRHDGWQVGHAWRLIDGFPASFVSTDLWCVLPPNAVGGVAAHEQLERNKTALAAAEDRSLIELVLQTGEPVWITDPSQFESTVGGSDYFGFQAAGGFPVVSDGRIVGVLELFSNKPRALNPRLMEVMPAIGTHLGHAVKRKLLEKLVADAAEREQRRIGSDIHDGIGQELTGLRHLAQTHAERLSQKNSPDAAIAARIAAGFETVQKQLRSIIRDLMPVEVESQGLVSALQRLAERTSESYGIDCTLYCPQPMAITNNLAATHIFRIAQEAVSNAAKHAKSREISIRLNLVKGELVLQVIDDGIGIQGQAKRESFGISTMNSRAELLGGTLQLSQTAGRGTEVYFSLPLRRALSEGETI